jgi:mono/diheme cytochrome c family protein
MLEVLQKHREEGFCPGSGAGRDSTCTGGHMSARYLFGVLVLCLAVGVFRAQEKKPEEKAASGAAASGQAAAEPVHPAKITDEDKARKNPTRFSTVSVERGKKIFMTQCTMCHGETGDGKGEVVAEMKINPPDFTKPETLKDRTDGELFAILGVGSEVMPSQGTRMTDSHKWNIVNFLRTLSGKVPEKATGKEPEENVILVPQ